MKVLVSPDGESTGKFASMVQAYPGIWSGSVLDALPKKTVVGNLGTGLPFDAASSDTVVALDVLEHTDDIYKSFPELCRVARSHVLTALPNLYEIKGRKRFFFGRPISGKYRLPQLWD